MLYRSKLFIFLTFYFLVISVWWVKFNFFTSFEGEGYWYNVAYGLMALVGALYGFRLYKKWGGLKTLIGKALFLLSLGLLSEWIANSIWGYFNIVKQIEIPYPSIADFFFFSIIPIYFFAIFFLGKASGSVAVLKKARGMFVVVILSLFMLAGAYYLFLREGIEFSNPIKVFFDLAYPLGYVVTFSITLAIYIFMQSRLGGIMKKVVLLVLVSYLIQFLADYTFLYRALQGTYVNGGIVDFLYSIALFAMPVALLNFNMVLKLFKSELGQVDDGIIDEEISVDTTNIAQNKIYITIIKEIIIDQEKIIGPLAIEYAKRVSGLNISGLGVSDLNITIIGGVAPTVLKELVEAYKEIFGNASVTVVKESIAKVLQTEPSYKNIIGSF